MVTTAMAMAMNIVQKINKQFCTLIICTLTLQLEANEWTFDPYIKIEGIHTDNVELLKNAKIQSYVSQTSFSIDTQFVSRMADFSLQSSTTYATYSHDHDLNNDFSSLNGQGKYLLWTDGPVIIASVKIANVNKNNANNSLADLVSSDTVQTRDKQTGLLYNIDNSKLSFHSSIIYNTLDSDDNIGESSGYSASIKTTNNQSFNNMFWLIKANYTERKNLNLTGRMYDTEVLIGFLTPMNLTPFIRYFNEDSDGNIASGSNAMSSWGPGIRWQLSPHLFIDSSYNYIDNEEESSNDYLSANINWQPSNNTSLNADYSRRFFGNSFNLQFSHKTKRLTNEISYAETINAFDRNNYQRVALGNYWCPIETEDDITQCIAGNNSTIDIENFNLVSLFDLVLIESNEFSLSKSLSLKSTLSLARTTFTLSATHSERESLSTGIIDNILTASFALSRKLSGKSELRFNIKFNHNEFNKEHVDTQGQKDDYRTFSSTYSRKIGRSLSSNFTLQYLDRVSSNTLRTYSEARATITIKKDF